MELKRALIAAIAGLACVGLAACGNDDDGGGQGATGAGAAAVTTADKEPITVAVVTYKVPGLDLLTPMTAGAEAAAKKINAEGGIGGHKLVITSCNSMFQPATATTCARGAVKDGALAMIGCDGAWATSGLKVMAAAQIPSINCLNGPGDATNKWNFGITPSGMGEDQALAAYLCERKDVTSLAFFGADSASTRPLYDGTKKVLQGCGKRSSAVFYPPTTSDLTPYVQKAVATKPDFVLLNVFGAQTVPVVQGLAQSGIKPSQVAVPDSNLAYSLLSQAGSALDGIYAIWQFTPWDQADDPQVSAYLAALEGSDVDARDGNVMWGYSNAMMIQTVAKALSDEELTPASVVEFLQTQNDVPIPLSRKLANPGPAIAPQQKQPFARIYQYKDEKFRLVPAGPEKDGWLEGWK